MFWVWFLWINIVFYNKETIKKKVIIFGTWLGFHTTDVLNLGSTRVSP